MGMGTYSQKYANDSRSLLATLVGMGTYSQKYSMQ
jgi:hypothetical protein